MQLNLSANIFQNFRSFPWQASRFSQLHLHRSSSVPAPRRTYGACSNTRRNCILKLSLLGSIGIDHNLRCPSEVFPREYCTSFYILLWPDAWKCPCYGIISEIVRFPNIRGQFKKSTTSHGYNQWAIKWNFGTYCIGAQRLSIRYWYLLHMRKIILQTCCVSGQKVYLLWNGLRLFMHS